MSQEKSGSSNRRNILLGLGLAAAGLVVIGYYTLDFPSGGDKLAGTIAPAERYRAPQIQQQDVTLGNQDVALLMQSEAFERLAKNPEFQALIADEGFLALAQNTDAMQAVMENAYAFSQLAQNKAAFRALAGNDAAAMASVSNAAAIQTFSNDRKALEAMQKNQSALNTISANANFLDSLAINAKAIATMGGSRDFAALAQHTAFARLLAQAGQQARNQTGNAQTGVSQATSNQTGNVQKSLQNAASQNSSSIQAGNLQKGLQDAASQKSSRQDANMQRSIQQGAAQLGQSQQ